MNEHMRYPELNVLSDEHSCDVVFVVENHEIIAHKQFLSVKSRVFRELFTSYDVMNEYEKTVVPIEETTYNAFRILIHYLYCDELVIEDNEDLQLIEGIARISVKYKVLKLMDEISNYLENKIIAKSLLSPNPITDPLIMKMKECNDTIHNLYEWLPNDPKLDEINESINKLQINDMDLSKNPEINYFMNEDLSDVVFIIEGQRVPALKQLLIIKSRVFRTMFSEKFIESTEKEVVIKDTTFNAFKKFIYFLYFNQLLFEDTDDSDIYKIFELLDRFEVIRFNKNDCNQIKITVENFKMLFELGIDFEIENLKTKIMSFINENIDYLHENNFKDIQNINEWTDNKLLDVLNESNEPKNESNLVYYRFFEDHIISASKKILENGCNYSLLISNSYKSEPNIYKIRSNPESFKSFIGYIYFEKLNFNRIKSWYQINGLFSLAKNHSNCKLMSEIIEYLKNGITFGNSTMILQFASNYDIKELSITVMELIEKSLNQDLISKEFICCLINCMDLGLQFSDEYKYKILHTLTTNTIDSHSSIKFDINGRVVPLIIDIGWRRMSSLLGLRQRNEVITIKDTTFQAFQTIVGFVYFNRLIFEDNTEIDFQLILKVCKLAQKLNLCFFFEKLTEYFEDKIDLNRFEIISKTSME